MEKKGVSPIIATILLIALVIIIGVIIFFWMKSMTQEAVTKFDNQNIEMVCNNVNFYATYSGGILYLSNNGNIPIYDFKIKIEDDGSYSTSELSNLTDNLKFPETGLNPGGAFSGDVNVGNPEKITLIPILIGKNEQGEERTYTCEGMGQEIVI